MIKQNQSLYRPFPGQQVSLKHYDHLSNNKCSCQICQNRRQKLNPQISIDEKYQILKTEKSKMLSNKSLSLNASKQQNDIQDYDWYLKKLAFECQTLPNFPILDAMVFDKGQMSFYIYFQSNKCKLHYNSQNRQLQKPCKLSESLPYSLSILKQKFMQRKTFFDIQYQKSKYKQLNPTFQWAQLDHDSEKLIKQFQKKLQFIDQMLNRVAIIKQYEKISNQFYSLTKSQQFRLKQNMIPTIQQQQSEKVLSKYQFFNLFDKTRMKICELQDISLLQIFPIMYGEQQHSYVKQIKYFRKLQSGKQLFKQAQTYVLSWLQKNQTLEKMQQQWINSYFYNEQNLQKIAQFPHTLIKRLNSSAEDEYLMYQSYKLLLHLQTSANVSIEQCLLQFVTQNDGSTFYLKQIKYIKFQQKHQVQEKENQLPTYKHIDKDDYIYDLKSQMKQMFTKVENQFERFNHDWQNFQNKTKNDRKQSDRVFKQVRGFKEAGKTKQIDPKQVLIDLKQFDSTKYKSGQWNNNQQENDDLLNLHKILKSNDQKYKQQMLGINHRFKFNESKQSNISKPLNQSKTAKKQKY